MKKIFFSIIFLISLNGYSQSYGLGDKILSFTLKNINDNNLYNLSDNTDVKGITLIFTNNSCPYAKLYESRVIDLANEFKEKKVPFVFINSQPNSNLSDVELSALAQYSSEHKITFPFLLDPQGLTSKKFGASKIPECYVLKFINGSFVLFYKGAIDDNPQTSSDVSNFYLKDAINSLLLNNPVKISERRPSGCMIPLN